MSAHGVLAATLVKPGQYELREYPLPEPGPGCVLVKMEMSGICGTDKHTFQGYVTQYGARKLEFRLSRATKMWERLRRLEDTGGTRILREWRRGWATAWWWGRMFRAGSATSAGTIFRTTAARRRRITGII